jgi:hypothetical protein
MRSRSSQTLQSVLTALESMQSPQHLREDKIGNQTVHVAGVENEVVYQDASGNYALPPTTAECLMKIAAELNLGLYDDINKKSTIQRAARIGATLIIEATVHNQQSVVTALINHGADPSICDDDDNNAIIHAAKMANSHILKEFVTLIRTKENTKKETVDEKREVAPTDLNSFKQTTALAAPVQRTTKAAEFSERITLAPDVLLHKNKAGETATKIIEQYKLDNPPTPAARDKKQKPKQQHQQSVKQKADDSDTLARFQALVDELHTLNPLDSEPKPLPQNNAKADEKKPEPQKVDASYQEKVKRVERTYDQFFKKKVAVLTVECKRIARVYTDIDQARAREKIRLNNVAEGKSELPEIPTKLIPTSMPVSYEDQAHVDAAFSVLKDYFAPHSAPLFESTKWNSLRRLLTFHSGRRYCKEAETLYNKLIVMPRATPTNIAQIHDAIDKQLEQLRARDHDKKDKNSIFNSSFTRRLYYIREKLKKTDAYKAVSMPDDVYLSSIDAKYTARGILGVI